MNPLNVGLIGYGYAGQTFHAPLIQATTGLQLTTVASSNAAKVHASLGTGIAVVGAEALIDDDSIDLIVIATPNELHHPLALAALKAGHHVVVDKPFALDAAQARELIDTATCVQRVLSVFHNRRWDSDFLTLQQLLRDGTLGRPVELVSHFDRYRPEVRQRWREGSGPGAGLWMDLGPHLVDQALQLFGRPSSVTLDRAGLRDGAVTDDWFAAQLRWADGDHAGLRVRLHASMIAARPNPRFALHAIGGSWTVDGLDPQEAMLKNGAGAADLNDPNWGADARSAALWRADGAHERGEPMPLVNGAYPAYYAAVRDAIGGEAQNPVAAIGALDVQCVLDAGRESVERRAEVDLLG